MASFSLDDIRIAAETKYASTDITFVNADGEPRTLILVNALRLPKAARKAITEIQDADNVDRDETEVFSDLLGHIASDANTLSQFMAVVGEDLTVLATVFERYSKATQVGEA